MNVTGALVWGYGVRSFGMGATVPRFFLLNIIVALVNSAVAAPIVAYVFAGATGHASDALTATFAQAGRGLLESTFASSVIVSLADKIISGFVAVSIIEALPPLSLIYTAKLRLPAPTGMQPILLAVHRVVLGVAFLLLYCTAVVKPLQPA